jgi:adenosylcobinamide-phosphate synthase
MIFALQFISAFCLDLILGDPRSVPHPVQLIGWLCTRLEVYMRKHFADPSVAGTLTSLLVIIFTLVPVIVVFACLHFISPFAEGVFAILLLYTSIACRSLSQHSLDVYRALQGGGGLADARIQVGKIVGRDTSGLDVQGVCRASVETVAENLVDGVISPLFFAFAFSLIPAGDFLAPISLAVIGAYGYKAINTMDSMFGYKNEKYLNFGRTAALVDDVVNFIPARISGFLIVIAAFVLRLDGVGAFKMLLRDRLQHASPNGGHPEAAVAGSMGVQLGGSSTYFGKIVEKQTLGDSTRLLEPADILTTNRLMLVTAVIFSGLFLIGRIVITGV